MEQLIPLIGQVIERCVIAIGGIIIVYLGYRLYLFGAKTGRGELSAKLKFADFLLKGSGPGLFFMAFGSIILITALFTGKVITEAEWYSDIEITNEEIDKLSLEEAKQILQELSKNKKIKVQRGKVEWLEQTWNLMNLLIVAILFPLYIISVIFVFFLQYHLTRWTFSLFNKRNPFKMWKRDEEKLHRE